MAPTEKDSLLRSTPPTGGGAGAVNSGRTKKRGRGGVGGGASSSSGGGGGGGVILLESNKKKPSIAERSRSTVTVNRWMLLFSTTLLLGCLAVAIVVPVVKNLPSEREQRRFYRRRHHLPPPANDDDDISDEGSGGGGGDNDSYADAWFDDDDDLGDDVGGGSDKGEGGESEGGSSSGHRQTRRYVATQFISFTVDTLAGGEDDDDDDDDRGARSGDGVCGDHYNSSSSSPCLYPGVRNVTEEGVDRRLAILEEFLERIKAEMAALSSEEQEGVGNMGGRAGAVDVDPRVLKVVAVPEFFLTSGSGGPRAYSVGEACDSTGNGGGGGALLQFVDGASSLVNSDDAFRDFLFVLGTAAVVNNNSTIPQSPSATTRSLYYSFMPVVRGGTGHRHRYLFLRRYVGGPDFLSRETPPATDAEAVLPSGEDSDSHRHDGDAISPTWMGLLADAAKERGTTLVDGDGGNLVDVDGIRIGLEVSLDHGLGALWSKLKGNNKRQRLRNNKKKQQQQQQLVDVQIISSAGTAIEQGQNPVVPGGVVYLSDGGATSAACVRGDRGQAFDPDRVCRAGPAGLKHVPAGVSGYSGFLPPAACLDVGEDRRPHQGACAQTLELYGIGVADEFKYHPPSIEIYPTVDLPPRSSPTSRRRR